MFIDRTLASEQQEELNIDQIVDNPTETPVAAADMTLTDFLTLIEAEKTAKVNIGGRFKNYDFEVRAMTIEEITAIRNKTTTYNRKREVVSTKDEEFQMRIIVEGCVTPNFKSTDFVKAKGVITPEQAVKKTLLAGEIIKLATLIMGASGLMDVDEIEEQAKNL